MYKIILSAFFFAFFFSGFATAESQRVEIYFVPWAFEEKSGAQPDSLRKYSDVRMTLRSKVVVKTFMDEVIQREKFKVVSNLELGSMNLLIDVYDEEGLVETYVSDGESLVVYLKKELRHVDDKFLSLFEVFSYDGMINLPL